MKREKTFISRNRAIIILVVFVLFAVSIFLLMLSPDVFILSTMRDGFRVLPQEEVNQMFCRRLCNSYCTTNPGVENSSWSELNITINAKNTNCGEVFEGVCRC